VERSGVVRSSAAATGAARSRVAGVVGSVRGRVAGRMLAPCARPADLFNSSGAPRRTFSTQ
jgi:hypothetical protein